MQFTDYKIILAALSGGVAGGNVVVPSTVRSVQETFLALTRGDTFFLNQGSSL